MKTQINWAEERSNASLSVNDGVITSYTSDLLDVRDMRDFAESYASTYDHNGNDYGWVVAKIENIANGAVVTFAFDGLGNFEWETDRDFVSY